MIGHNNGPALDGLSYRRFAWKKARADLLPTLPIEILRVRVKRAQALGLPYKTYASVRASTGRDVVGFLFSNNALRVLKAHEDIPATHADKLRSVSADFAGLAHRPLSPEDLEDIANRANLALATGPAPHFDQPWSDLRQAVLSPLQGLPKDGVLVIGDTSHERLWSEAGKLAGYLPSERYFG